MHKLIADTETTGFHHTPEVPGVEPDRICEIALIGLTADLLPYTEFHTWLDPERELHPGAAKVNGLTWERLKGEPKFADISQRLQHTLAGCELIIHNAPFDVGFLDAEFRRLDPDWPGIADIAGKITCTRAMARSRLPGIRHHLDTLCDHYGIDRSAREIHDATTDCRLLAQVYARLLREPAATEEAA